jgi:hypothetical protein
MGEPVILFSSLENLNSQGDAVANGGFKLQTVWVKLLRAHGHTAYRMTLDGHVLPWMIEPAPAISYVDAVQMVESGQPVTVVTTWMAATLALQLTDHPYFFDAELAHSSSGRHFEALKHWWPKFGGVATHARHQHAWYLSQFQTSIPIIQEWSDTDYWYPAPEQRVENRVGFMIEGPHTMGHIDIIRRMCQEKELPVEFYHVQGSERDVIDQLRSCDVFLGMNPGKHVLFGEGCPRSQQESLHAGCVLIAGDVLGNREFLIDGYTGYLVPRLNPQAMGERLIWALQHRQQMEIVRARGTDFVQKQFAPTESKYQQVKEWLRL